MHGVRPLRNYVCIPVEEFRAINLLLDSIALASTPLLNVTAPHGKAGVTNVQETTRGQEERQEGQRQETADAVLGTGGASS